MQRKIHFFDIERELMYIGYSSGLVALKDYEIDADSLYTILQIVVRKLATTTKEVKDLKYENAQLTKENLELRYIPTESIYKKFNRWDAILNTNKLIK
jgi:hypothetical protein